MSSHKGAVLSRVTLPNIIAQPRSRRTYQATVNKLPDDVFLDIFDFYLNGNVPDRIQSLDEWHTLVHVCRRWRNLVFASPRRLNLQLLCRKDRPVREMLDIWPALPIAIRDHWIRTWEAGEVNITAALKHPDRVRSIVLDDIGVRSLGYLTAVMRVPFPELTHLDLWWSEEAGLSNPVLTNSFLGGSAPSLRTLTLSGIIFPALPNLLLSASDLVDLSLSRLPHSGYISPEAMVACLSSMNRLKSLDLGFESPRSRPDQPSPPPQTRIVLPALTNLAFEGMAHYSEDLLSRIDTPVLNKFSMTFFLDRVDIPHFKLLIDRAKGFKPSKAATLLFDPAGIRLELDQPCGSMLIIPCRRVDWQVDSMVWVCRQLSPFFSLVQRLDLTADYWPSLSQVEGVMVSSRLLELFQPFTAIRGLYVSKNFIPLIATALQELIGERATEVLPNLRDIFFGGSAMPRAVQEAMRPFVDARRLSGQAVAVHRWERSTTD